MYSTNYSYLPCQFCVGKNHCKQCADEIRQSLLGLDGVVDVQIDADSRRLSMTVDGVDVVDITDQAETLGVFL